MFMQHAEEGRRAMEKDCDKAVPGRWPMLRWARRRLAPNCCGSLQSTGQRATGCLCPVCSTAVLTVRPFRECRVERHDVQGGRLYVSDCGPLQWIGTARLECTFYQVGALVDVWASTVSPEGRSIEAKFIRILRLPEYLLLRRVLGAVADGLA